MKKPGEWGAHKTEIIDVGRKQSLRLTRIVRGNKSEGIPQTCLVLMSGKLGHQYYSDFGESMTFRKSKKVGLVAIALLLSGRCSRGQEAARPGILPATAMKSAIGIPAAAQPSDHFDVEELTDVRIEGRPLAGV